MSTFSQRSFAGGEISPSLYARVDTVKYATGCRQLRNHLIMRQGGAASRPGTVMIGEVKDSSKTVRLIPFVFNSDQTYMLEFGDLYMRVIRDGEYQSDLTLTITGITTASPGVVTYTGTDPANGDEVYISGVVGTLAPYVNGRNFKVASVNTVANTFVLQDMASANFNTTGLGSYTSGGTAERVYTLTTPYVEADLPTLQFIQSADVITLTHPTYAPRTLTRSGHTSWALATLSVEPDIDTPSSSSSSGGTFGTHSYKYRVTAISSETGEESLPAMGTVATITAATKANPILITTTTTHNFVVGDEVYITGVVGMTEINGLTGIVSAIGGGGTTFNLTGVNSTGYTTYVSGGTVRTTYARINAVDVPNATTPNQILFNTVTGAHEYNIYKELNGIFGFIGVAAPLSSTSTATFQDIGYTPDTSDTPPTARNPFNAAGDYPSAVAYIQQRLVFANTNNHPETVYLSRTGQYYNFTTSNPIQDDDAITFSMTGRQVNEVRHVIDIGKPVVFTSGGVWTAEGDQAGTIRPTDINLKQQSYEGCSTLPPLVVGGNALYVQARGSIVIDLRFTVESSGYRGNDLTVYAAHLVNGFEIVDWTYQQTPHSVLWAVRDDGALIGLTYLRENEIWGWHRHDTDGLFENVCAIPEGNEDALYLVVKRTINGVTKRFVERMPTRQIDDIVDYIGMDCAGTYDGRHRGSTTMDLSSAGGWTYTDTLTLTASTATFTSDDVGNSIYIFSFDDDGAVDEIVRCEITAYTSTTVVSVRPNKTVPVALRSATLNWSRAVDQITGLWHLEGKQVSVFGDGYVVASPYNATYATRTVTNGTIDLGDDYAVVHVGLPYLCDLETLDIDTAQNESIIDKSKCVGSVTVSVEASRGIWVGTEPPSDDEDDALEGLTELKLRDDESYEEPIDLTTGPIDVVVQSQWNKNGRVFIRQVDPLPQTILAVMPTGMFPFRGGA